MFQELSPDAMTTPHAHEPHGASLGSRLNWLRAGVLGANDGIVSVAGLVVGVAGADAGHTALAASGIAGLVAGALSMAGGEYVSVSTQRDTERAMVRLEAYELATMPEAEERELADMYEERGLSPELAARVARELTERDALRAHSEMELGIDPDEYTNPWHAAGASSLSFAIGATLPLAAMTLTPAGWRVWATAVAVTLALALTGYVSARLGRAGKGRAVLRNVGVGVLTMTVTYVIGTLFGVAVG
ncbi:VIT1/CCC1 family predicted Fe2+/Mn2+ transporter [Stackebrandtia albiflava]|uniref:VIT1/CCC1 family predicted Fe2+/Mn2+ transporter n=1 Tax=Stackebrandtia albiflava TaxID=406432 RepID=A0A562V2P4_9ACTN|nr:VIT family protein [Stackebrandtia albiflava]TWJ12077.1 VIT1/CCC1 family predicted Fe2+/Mn2+ transporter [Stackebrandtia albiflava]